MTRGELETSTAVPRGDAPPGRAARLLALLGGAVFALGVAELGMRLYCYAPRALDGELGFVPAAGQTARWHKEGEGDGHWGPSGIRMQPSAGRDGAPVVLVLGDSLTEAMQVDDDAPFAARLQQHLDADRLDFAVKNSGIAGVTIARFVALAPEYRRRFTPRWTVIQLSEPDLSEAWATGDAHFERSPDGGVVVVGSSTAAEGSPLRKEIRARRAQSSLLQNAVMQLRGIGNEWRAWHPFRATLPPAGPPPEPAWKSLPVEAELAAPVDAFEGRATLLLLPDVDLASPDTPSELELRFAETCARRGWSCVNPRDEFAGLARRGAPAYGFPNSGFNTGHLNEDGHAAVARALAKELRRLAGDGLL